jgi:uncharacterized protein YdcH (DUF465 family)
MESLETEVSGRSSDRDSEYRKLVDEHRRCEQKLERISARRPFTPQDWFERSEIKKHKLRLKDRMARLERYLDRPEAAEAGGS